MTDGRPSTKTRINVLIGSTFLRMRSIKKQERDGKCTVKLHIEKYSVWCIKIIWKLQYEYADFKINLFRDSTIQFYKRYH